MAPSRPLTSEPTESVITLLDTGSLSASDLSRQRILSGGYSLDSVTQALQEAHSEIGVLKRLVQELTAKNGSLETDARLLVKKVKSKKYERTSIASMEPKTVAKKVGTIYIFFFCLVWDKKSLFGPRPPASFDPHAPLANARLLALHRLYVLLPEDYHDSIKTSKTDFSQQIFEGGVETRSNQISRIRANITKILGSDFPGVNVSILEGTRSHSQERLDCAVLCELLGYKAPAKENDKPVYNLVPAFLWKDRKKDDPYGFMVHDMLFRAGRCVVYGKGSISSAGKIAMKRNNQFIFPDVFVPLATDEFIACIGVLMIYVLSPDSEFPSGGKGDRSGINYYASYRAILTLLQHDDDVRQRVLNQWDAEVFPNSFPNEESGDEGGDEDPELQAALSAFSRTVATSSYEWDMPVSTPRLASQSTTPVPKPLSATLERSMSSLEITDGGSPTLEDQHDTASAHPSHIHNGDGDHLQPRQVSPAASAPTEPEVLVPPRPVTPLQPQAFDMPLARAPALTAVNLSRASHTFREVTPAAPTVVHSQGEPEEQPKKRGRRTQAERGRGATTSNSNTRTTRSQAGAGPLSG
ncbi:hypothetical protein BKA70DRAFT_1452064 [Coprinopsis sp. MPI-PUGE-AT-0042]|nr:hypothetical protein BKA70DRAFT_1452064 [Coprinopsis sp. MPI-PUGE-AT-0042]